MIDFDYFIFKKLLTMRAFGYLVTFFFIVIAILAFIDPNGHGERSKKIGEYVSNWITVISLDRAERIQERAEPFLERMDERSNDLSE